jgi:hypothetical protein
MPAQSYEAATTELSTHRSQLGDLGFYSLLYALQWAWSGLNVWTDVTYAYPQSAVVVPGQFAFPKPPPIPGDPAFPVDVGTLLDTWRALVVLLKLTRKGSATGPGPSLIFAGTPGQEFVLSIGGNNVLSIGGNNVLSIGGTPGQLPGIVNGPVTGVVLPPAPPAWVFRYFGYRL